MSKSTPISQLPNQGASGNFINDQQKQMFSQAQNAVQNMTLPQATQPVADVVNEDDNIIQEVLNSFANNNNNSAQSSQQNIEHMVQQQNNPTMYQPPMMPPPQGYSPQINAMDPMLLNMLANQVNSPQQTPTPQYTGSIESFINVFADDIKLAALVLIVFVVVNFIPLERIIGKYIAIEKIPYHDILLKALLGALLVVFARKIITQK